MDDDDDTRFEFAQLAVREALLGYVGEAPNRSDAVDAVCSFLKEEAALFGPGGMLRDALLLPARRLPAHRLRAG